MARRKQRRGRNSRSQGNGPSIPNRGRHGHLGHGAQHARALRIEQLEDRRLLAVFAVNNFADLDSDDVPVVGSLRQAVALANANEEFDTIIFQDFLFDNGPGAIGLNGSDAGGALLLTAIEGVEIIGPGPGLLTISAGGANRIFLVDDADDARSSVTISGVTLSGGSPLADDEDGLGGAILNRETLRLEEVIVANNSSAGGGGIFNDIGSLYVDRSLIQGNTSLTGGGGIQNGLLDQTEDLPTTTIVNSTITGNTAIGVPDGDVPTGYGGGVLNSAGFVSLEQSTIYGNTAPIYGGGVASQGFDPAVDEMGAPTVTAGLATTDIRSSIIVGNTVAGGVPDDVGSVGMTEETEMAPAKPFDPQINSRGYNLFGTITHPKTTSNMSVVLPPNGTGDVTGYVDPNDPNDPKVIIPVDPGNVFIDVPDSMPPVAWLNDFGGVLPVFMPDINKIGGRLAIDLGDPEVVNGGNYDQRGFQFVRTFDATGAGMPRMDIGAAEVQVGNFLVDTLVDDSDGRYSRVPTEIGFFPLNSVSMVPDFSLREALEQVQKNDLTGLSGVSTVTFSSVLTDTIQNPDPTLATPAPTILLTLGELSVTFPVIIQGPAFDLEVDATGNDPTSGINNGDGTQVFSIFDTVEINNLILRGSDSQEFGGAITTFGDLTLRNSTILDNATTGNGGAVYVAGGTLLVDGTTIRDNTAATSGGGIYIASGNVTVNNSTISGNTGFRGGGIANVDGDLLIRYSTITLNDASSTFGSGIASYRDASAVTQIRSSIIANNTINDVQNVKSGANSIVSLGYNLIGDGNAVADGVFTVAAGDQFNVADPILAPLARLGGPTPVHRLLPGSPAIDMGDPNPAGLGSVPIYDQREFPFDRIEDVATGGRIDIGAFEVPNDVLLVGDGSALEGSFSTFVAALDESNLTPTHESIVFLPTLEGEDLPSNLAITDSVEIIGLVGFRFLGDGGLQILVDDGDNSSLLDVSISNIRMQDNTTIVSRENLTLTNMEFVNNTSAGAISHQDGKLTINDGTFIGNSNGSGGAISVVNGELEINNTLLSGNSAVATGGKGGAIFLQDSTFTANYLYITGNIASAASGEGGGIFALDSTITLTNAIISGNSTTGSNSEGGGFAMKDSDLTLVDSTIASNATLGSQSPGGGIFFDGGSLNLQNSNVFGNKTYGQSSPGGGIASVNAEVTITGTSVNRNESTGDSSDGGGIHVSGGNLTVRDSSVIDNQASASNARGGGIYSTTDLSGTSQTTIVNSTISGNSAGHAGGGVFNAGGLTEIKHSTITNNLVPAYGFGGGVGSYGDAATTLTQVGSTIIAGNTLILVQPADFNNDDTVDGFDFLSWQRGFGTTPATKTDGDANGDTVVDGTDLSIWEAGFAAAPLAIDVDRVDGNFDETFQSLGYNLIGGGLSTPAFGAAGDQTGVTDAGLDPVLKNNGGPTKTHALLAGSPAIDMGDPAFDPSSFTPILDQDQTGNDRVANGRIDVGAFEFPVAAPIVASLVVEEPLVSAILSSSSESEAVILIEPSSSPVAAPVNDSLQSVTGLASLQIVSSSTTQNGAVAANIATNSDDANQVALDALLADFPLPATGTDFEEIATSHSLATATEDPFAAEDHIFDLIGSDVL